MELSKIVEEMWRIATSYIRPEYRGSVLIDVVTILKREESQIPITDALWITQPDGTYITFADNVANSMIARYCRNQSENILNGNIDAKCRRIDFSKGEISEVSADEFLKTIKHLESMTGENEVRISVDGDPKLYLNSAIYADRHNEIEALRNSARQNEYCANSLYYVIGKDFDGTAAHDHLTAFSLERTIFVAAASVINSENQTAFDEKSVEWAKLVLGDIPPSIVEASPSINIKPEALSEFILNKLIPTAEAEAARNAENTEFDDTDGLDRF